MEVKTFKLGSNNLCITSATYLFAEWKMASWGCTGKSLWEALIFALTNPQYADIFFIELQVQYVKIPSSEHGESMFCAEIDFDIQNNLCTQHVLSLEFSCNQLAIQWTICRHIVG